VASYVALPSEPDTAGLHRMLLERGVEVCLPRLRGDGALDLVLWRGGPLPTGPRGVVEPPGPAVDRTSVDVVVLPALAVDPRTGVRLGRGGGSYDRLLATLPAETALVALLADVTELQDLAAYAAWHDRPVHAAATPDGVHRCGGA
jgi:5-formyltetrahydrofolate cyclo-ligase